MIRSVLPLLVPLALAVSAALPTALPTQDIGTDIYGRPLPRRSSDVDPYGRPIDPPVNRPGDLDELGVDIFGRPLARNGENPYRQLLGCWQLFDLDHPDLGFEGQAVAGNMLISDHFLSLEFHIEYPGKPDFFGELYEILFQSGIHEYQIDQLGQLKTSALIGSALSDERELLWQPAGDTREYGIEFSDNALTLINDEGARFTFTRVRPTLVEPGFFGNTKGELDPFGRKIDPTTSVPEDPSTGTDG